MRVLLVVWLILVPFFTWSQAEDSTGVETGLWVSDSAQVSQDSVDVVEPSKEFDPIVKFAKKFQWGYYIRLRHELWDNQEDLNDDLDDLYSFFRAKIYLGAGYKPSKNTQFYARIVNESRLYGHKGDGDSIDNDHIWRPERHYFELVFAKLYFRWRNIAGLPLEMKVGRQYLHNVGFGNQWLIGDGTTIDGSKTFYFNAFRLTYQFQEGASLDLVALHNWQEDPLVIYSEVDRTVTNITDESGGWLWWKSRFNNTPYDLYYIYKHEQGGGGFHRQERSNIHTLGLSFRPESDSWWLNAQFAGQLGTYGNKSRNGYGTIIYGGYKIATERWSIRAGPWFMLLSGDDPETSEFEAFNNLYGGYPNDDELYINTWARESGTSMWTNINLFGAYMECRPSPKYNIKFWYHYMRAAENVNGAFFGQGKNRGHMFMLKALGEISKRLKAYYMFEYLLPGDFYNTSADNAFLSRVNFEWIF